MRKLSRVSKIMTTDERIIIRREQQQLGDDVILINGEHVRRGYTYFESLCSVQSPTGDDVILDASGNRLNNQLYFYTWDDAQKLQPNDHIYRPEDGLYYVVQACETWGSFSKARGQEEDIGPFAENTDLLVNSPSLAPPLI